MESVINLVRLLAHEPLLPAGIGEYQWITCASGTAVEVPVMGARRALATQRIQPQLSGQFGERRFGVGWDEELRVAVVFYPALGPDAARA